MGFRKDAYATVWEAEKKSETMTKVRISITRKNKLTGQYESEFSGFVSFYGLENAAKAKALHEKDRIQLGDVDVCTRYDKEKQREYIDYKCFSFKMSSQASSQTNQSPTEGYNAATEGENLGDNEVPF